MDYIINIAWHDGRHIPIQAHSIERGLAIHQQLIGITTPTRTNTWVITHITSGKFLVENLPDISTALTALNNLLDIEVDWTQGEEAVRGSSLKWKIRDVMEFWQDQIRKYERGLA